MEDRKEEKITIRTMLSEDIEALCKAEGDYSETNINYLQNQIHNQDKGESIALLALYEGKIAGIVFLYYKCKWGAMGNQGIPSIVDLRVFEKYRRNGVATKLMDMAERIASEYCNKIYLDVCLNSEYGAAQRLYVKRGYIPDGKGLYYEQKICPIDAECKNDDEMTLCLVKNLVSRK